MNGRRLTITTILEAAQRRKDAGIAVHQPCTQTTGFRYVDWPRSGGFPFWCSVDGIARSVDLDDHLNLHRDLKW